jgi:uncharacterized protein (DUF2384 family)
MNDQQLLQSSAGKAGEILNLYEWSDDIALLRIFKNLYSLNGGDNILMRHWMHTSNQHLRNRFPVDLIKSQEGTEEILSYLHSFQNWS